MRKMVKRHIDQDKRRQRFVMLFALFMIGLMVFSLAGVIIYNPVGENRMSYGDYEFYLQDQGDGNNVLVTSINGQEVQFQALPAQVSYLEMDPSIIPLLKQATQIIITADPTNLTLENAMVVDYAKLQLGLAFPNAANAIAAADERYQLPVITCAAASPESVVILLNASNQSRAYQDNYCIILEGEQAELLWLKDRLIYEYIGIMQNGEIVE